MRKNQKHGNENRNRETEGEEETETQRDRVTERDRVTRCRDKHREEIEKDETKTEMGLSQRES